MSDRKTKTGFDIKLTGFLEFHAEDLFTETAKDPKVLTRELTEVLERHGVEGVDLTVKHRKRKTIIAA